MYILCVIDDEWKILKDIRVVQGEMLKEVWWKMLKDIRVVWGKMWNEIVWFGGKR